GLVFTNRHLVRDADKIRVTALDGATWEADLVHEDDPTNTALLRLRLPPGKQVPAVARGSLASVEVGETVLALGNPEGRALTVRRGVVSAVRGKRLQIDAGIGNQNGGGAIVSLRGELLAVVDGGKVDWVEVAYAHRGEQAKVETGLDLSPGIDDLGERYRVALDRYGSTVPASAGEAPPAAAHPVAAVVRKAGAAMLNVRVEQDLAALAQEDNPFAPPASRAQPRGLGSGVVIDESGLALTNWHVVDEATEPDGSAVPGWIVRAYLRDGRSYVADVLSISREEDLALIRLRLPPEERLTAIELGSSAHLSVGDLAVAIGNPHGRADTVTAGVITAKNQAIRVKGRWRKLKHLLETDAAINAGNSGGALLDAAGRLIGINSAGGAAHAVTGYAIGVDHVREKLLGLLLSPEKLRSAYAGIEVIDQDGKVLVRAVDRHGPAAGAGVEPGDVVRAVAGRPVCCSVAFALAWRELADERVELSLERAGKSRVVALTPMSAAAWAVFRQTGLVVREVSIVDEPDAVQNAAVAGYRRFTGDPTAAPRELPGSLVRVERVHPETAARVAIRPGDFVFALQVVDEATGAAELMHLQRTAELQRGCNQLATYEGSTLTAWIVRGAEVQVVELPAKRVPW
ncbi:MAG TPA: trypsin-like peptidase domain-containing protein, partial [Planctomycetota bacterium]|nr:trypsin-like peptidase domain-containing protein [Planctomycetota bacterium]